MVSTDQIFSGNLLTADGFLLISPQDSPLDGEFHGLVDVDLDPSLVIRLGQDFDRQDISVLVHLDTRGIRSK